jgi:aspartate aminotransferase
MSDRNEFSKRISSLKPSPTLALNAKANQLKAEGVKVFNFAVGEPDFPTHKEVVRIAVEALHAGDTRYGPSGGGLPLRKAIVSKLARENGLDYKPEEVVCGMGAKEILFHLFLSLLNEGDEVIVTAPCWVSYMDHIKAAGAIPVVVPAPDSGPMVNPKTIEKYATAKTKAFLLCSPNNPSGYALNRNELLELGSYLKTKNWWVISDEIYEYLSFDHPHESIIKLVPELKEKSVHISGMAKGYAMTGWRVGYAAGPKLLIDLVRNLQSQSSTCIPPFIEKAAAWALDQGKSLMQKEIDSLAKRRDLAVTLLSKIKNVSAIKPQGAFYLFIDVRNAVKTSKTLNTSLKFSEHLLSEYQVACVPGEAFEAPGYLRFSYACSVEDLTEGLSRLDKAIQSLS